MENNNRLGDRLEAVDKEIDAWAKATRQHLLRRLATLGLKDRAKLISKNESLYKSVRSRLKKRDGEIESVAFIFARHGIFLERGVGKGRPVNSTQANQQKKAWLSAVLPDEIENLADLLEQEYADLAIENVVINIPGIISTKK